MNCMLSRCRP